MTLIPKLVKEKIQIYIDKIYQERWVEWKRNIYTMHIEYYECVHLAFTDSFQGKFNDVLIWRTYYGYYDPIICIIEGEFQRKMKKRNTISYKNQISQFTGKQTRKSKLPKKYFFSSGLNHIRAFK